MATNYVEKVRTEGVVKLGSVPAGETIRFASTSFGDALKNGDFWLVTKKPEEQKGDSVTLVNQKGEVKTRDPEHSVIVHNITIQVQP